MEDNILVVENYINGSFYATEKYIDSFNPSTGEILAKIPDSGQAEVDLAVEAAKAAFIKWSSISQTERSAILLKVADILEKNLYQFALEESLDQGKTLAQATTIEIPRAVLNFKHFATYAQHTVETSKIQNEFGALSYTTRTAVGVAGLISPWNLPLYLLTFKIAPAIAAGNTVVCKPSEMTSVTAWRLCSIFNQAGIPPGVVNMVFGYGHKVGEALVKHPDVPLISFTGSTVTGKRINTLAAEHFKTVSLEMGGKNSGIVFADVDLKKCIPTMIRSSFMNQGEVCLTTSRIFVQREIIDVFVQKFVQATRELIRVGPPLDAATTMGALISKEHLAKVESYVQLAENEGAKLLTGKEILQLPNKFKDGYFMHPVVITDVSDDSRCMQEEIFGPVVCIVPFDTEEEVILRSNNVKYGLCASVWSEDVGKIHRVAHKLEVGTVWANCWLVRCLAMPFGGMKESGIGREGSHESWEFFTQSKTVCVKYA